MKHAKHDPDPARRWLAFLSNHREAIAAMDFFTVPTLTFGVLYCFFVIGHDRRKILHCNLTPQPNALWIVLQLHEAWGYDQPHRFLIFDRRVSVFGVSPSQPLMTLRARNQIKKTANSSRSMRGFPQTLSCQICDTRRIDDFYG